ncbi:MAG: hydroxysqualene dehydroxylase HpnE [Reyranellaceae bacterium]
MTSAPPGKRVHVVGAGLAGLGAAVWLARRGVAVILYEAARQAGGRCRSFRDPQLDLVIDNGNHLVLSGNPAVQRYLAAIGAEDHLAGPAEAAYPYVDLATGRRWTLRPSPGRLPWWLLQAGRRVPGTGLADYLDLARLMARHPGRTIGEVLPCRGVLWDRFLRPLLVSVLNTPPEQATADLAGAVLRETFAKGGKAIEPRVASPSLAAAFVEPALNTLKGLGTTIHLGRRVTGLVLDSVKILHLAFGDDSLTLSPDDSVVLAVPPWTAAELLPEVVVPDAYGAILNAHFKIAPAAGTPLLLGLVGGTAEWVFAFEDRLSVTVSAADPLIDEDGDVLAARLWRDVAAAHGLPAALPPFRVVKEKRATFAATPAQEARRPAARTRWRNLFLAGDWTRTGLPATIEGALRSGETAAELAA